ncbi:uncharacterized protein LOC133825687 [Humulus lupulus]|uniref:uncharacterized protein LOC133825687 n=1 Tax=Humulus lupulus TaxID=3486 RepID=UPI002B402B87|nr:uncharacterized protein LOC133825687 [Humulus lupulus]
MKKWEEYSNVEGQRETNDAKTEEREGAGNKEKELARKDRVQLKLLKEICTVSKSAHYQHWCFHRVFTMKNEEIAAILQALDLKWEQRSESQLEHFKVLLEQHTKKTEETLSKVPSLSSPIMGGDGSVVRDSGRSGGRRSDTETDNRDVNSILKTLRVKVPRFDGSNVEDWVYKINKFFDLHRVELTMRLSIVAFHLDGVPSTWFQWMEKGGSFSDWEAFLRALQLCFGASIYDDPLGRISKLTQLGKVSDYRVEFESLMPRITGVQESMFLNFFIWWLKLEIRRELLMVKPVDLADAMAKAQLFEERYDDFTTCTRSDIGRSGWASCTATGSHGSPSSLQAAPKTSSNTHGSSSTTSIRTGTHSLPVKRLTPAELKDRRDRGVCFTCDEKFSYGHKCKNRMLLLCQEDDDCHVLKEAEMQEFEEVGKEEATHGKETLEVLVDTGSNNNFIQESLAAQLKLPCEDTRRFKVYMGNGNFLLCTKICKEVELVLQGHKFMVDLYVFPICGLDVVLGMQWLQTLGPCVHDHKALTMEFNWQGSVVKLAVLAEPTSKGAEITSVEAKLPKEGHGLLTKFAAVFEEPKQLPPYRGVDHRVFLQLSTKPINVRPYRYPHFQKDVIEKLVKEMSDVGFIRPSTSPYSSPVLLVKKKDGTWRFCVDYRVLNGITVKDRFPIPTIDELLDELGTAAVFSKLDLRAGYHQIRMDR